MNGIHHISLSARDEQNFQEILDFYTKVLECPLVRTWGGERPGAMLDLGNTLLEVMKSGGADAQKGVFAHIAFAVDSTDAAVERVRQAGCKVFMEPCDKALGDDYPIRIAFFTGPAGEEIELFQER